MNYELYDHSGLPKYTPEELVHLIGLEAIRYLKLMPDTIYATYLEQVAETEHNFYD